MESFSVVLMWYTPRESVMVVPPPVLLTITPGTTYCLVESYTVPDIIICPLTEGRISKKRADNNADFSLGKSRTTLNITAKCLGIYTYCIF